MQNLLEKKKNKGIIKLGQNRQGGVVVSQKQGTLLKYESLAPVSL